MKNKINQQISRIHDEVLTKSLFRLMHRWKIVQNACGMLLALGFLFHGNSAKAVILSVYATDWSIGQLIEKEVDLPATPDGTGATVTFDSTPETGPDRFGLYKVVGTGVTDWENPYVFQTELLNWHGWTSDEGGNKWGTIQIVGDGSIALMNNYVLDQVNQQDSSSTTYGLLHHYYTVDESDRWHIGWQFFLSSIGQSPSVSITNKEEVISAEASAGGSITRMVEVPPMTIAFTDDSTTFNLEPLSGSPSGRPYKDTDNAPVQASVGLTKELCWDESCDNNYPGQSTNSHSIFNGRTIHWYGAYADQGLSATDRASLDGYNTSGSQQIGELVTFEVIPAHPNYGGGADWGALHSFAFQVAMQLGSPVGRQPIYASSESTETPPTFSVPGDENGLDSVPVPFGTVTNGTIFISGFGLQAPTGVTNLQVNLRCQFGIITIQTTTGLTVTGNGTTNVVLNGGVTALSNAVNSLSYAAGSLIGTDIILISAIGPNGSLTRTLTICSLSCVPSGLVAWWRAETNGNDAVGNNNGTLQNGIGFSTGKVGMSFNFDGIDDHVRVGASTNIDVGQGNGFTIEGWIKPANITNQLPVVEWNDGYGDQGTHFWVNVSFGGVGGDGCLYANIKDSFGGDHVFASSPNLINPAIWQHVALTYDKTTGIACFYLDGDLVAIEDVGVFTPKTDTSLFFGSRLEINYFYEGRMDEMSLYNRELTSPEIQALFNLGSAGKCLP